MMDCFLSSFLLLFCMKLSGLHLQISQVTGYSTKGNEAVIFGILLGRRLFYYYVSRWGHIGTSVIGN